MRYKIVGDGSHIDINKGGEPRTTGVHLSAIIRVIAKEMGLLDRYEDNTPESWTVTTKLRMALGLSWEDWVQRQYPDVLYHPGELELDGVLMTPDGLHPNGTLYEYKVTWKSENTLFGRGYDHNHNWMWHGQNMGYLKAIGWTKCRQCIFLVNGDYRPPCPVFMEVDIEYTQQEIDDNWALMVKYKHLAAPEIHG